MNNLIDIIKEISVNANENNKPMNLFYGIVKSTSPLKIDVEQKMLLGKNQLILTRNVTDYRTNDGVLISNALNTGDKVILLRVQGGQKFLVLDRVVSL